MRAIVFACALLGWLLDTARGHGRLIEPPSRASAWRYGFDTPHNYNDHELFCGGFTRQWVRNEGKCGVCGDAWDVKTPRPHEIGGTYGQGVIVRNYKTGGVINIRVELTANHNGHFTFALCPNYRNTTQKCLDKRILRAAKPQRGLEQSEIRYYPMEGNKVYEIKYRLPKIACPHCVLQWRYIAGNNWGNCPNGTGAVGCGAQEEFRACADIAILGKATPTNDYDDDNQNDYNEVIPPTETTTLTPSINLPAEESYNPISALLISLMSFLVVFLILSLFYIHYYQIGKKVKAWLKSGGRDKIAQTKCADVQKV